MRFSHSQTVSSSKSPNRIIMQKGKCVYERCVLSSEMSVKSQEWVRKTIFRWDVRKSRGEIKWNIFCYIYRTSWYLPRIIMCVYCKLYNRFAQHNVWKHSALSLLERGQKTQTEGKIQFKNQILYDICCTVCCTLYNYNVKKGIFHLKLKGQLLSTLVFLHFCHYLIIIVKVIVEGSRKHQTSSLHGALSTVPVVQQQQQIQTKLWGSGSSCHCQKGSFSRVNCSPETMGTCRNTFESHNRVRKSVEGRLLFTVCVANKNISRGNRILFLQTI